MIAVAAGLVLFLTPLQLPDVLADTMTSMARAVGPVSMIMLGMALADIEWKKLFTGKRVYGMVLARMVLLPDQCDDYRGMRSNDAVDGYVIYDVRKEAEWTKQ